MNRFAKELTFIDSLLPIQLPQYINSIFQLFGVFAAMLFGNYYIIFAILPMVAIYIWFQTYFRYTSIELQRLEALSRAPILSQLSETMSMFLFIDLY